MVCVCVFIARMNVRKDNLGIGANAGVGIRQKNVLRRGGCFS